MSAAAEFTSAIATAGLTPPNEIISDGSIHRFSSNGKRGDTAGWYLFSADGGVFGDWRLGFTQPFRVDAGREFTPEEKAAYHTRLAEQKLAREQSVRCRHRAARTTATEIWDSAEPAPANHPYLIAKNVERYALKVSSRGELIIPIRDNGELHSLQFIAHDGQKRFLPGGRVHGCYHAIGNPGSTICIAEGYATSATIHQATNYPVAVAFGTGNLQPVAQTMRALAPHANIILCADDDHEIAGNPGITKARAASAGTSVGGVVAIPHFAEPRGKNTDFNDMAKVSGLESVREAVNTALSSCRAHGAVRDSPGITSFEQALQRIGRYRLIADRTAIADCPICDDDEMGSLTVTENGTDARVTCANGCNPEEILESLGGARG